MHDIIIPMEGRGGLPRWLGGLVLMTMSTCAAFWCAINVHGGIIWLPFLTRGGVRWVLERVADSCPPSLPSSTTMQAAQVPDRNWTRHVKPVQRPDQRRSTQVTDQAVLQSRKLKQDLPETEAEEAAMLAMERWREILRKINFSAER